MDLIDPEVMEMEDLVRRYLPGRVPQVTMEKRLGAVFVGGINVWWVGFAILVGNGWTPSGLSFVGSLLGALRAFFNRCEAKLIPLETRRRDQEESERLARLSDQADVEIAEARRTINLIGRDFIDDVLLVANALGGLERLALLERAAKVDVDQLEAVAERIVDASTADRRALGELEENLAHAAGRYI